MLGRLLPLIISLIGVAPLVDVALDWFTYLVFFILRGMASAATVDMHSFVSCRF
jgi:hypothetical protein